MTIERSKTVRCLGIILDENICLYDQIRSTVKTAFYNFKKIRKSIPRQILITISESFILAHINYCISIYNSLNDNQLKPLDN